MRVLSITILLFVCCNSSYAQLFDKIKKKVEDKAEKAADKILNKENGEEDGIAVEKGGPAHSGIASVFDFTAGDSVIFQDDFSNAAAGSMPERWKSGGTGEIISFPGVGGNWLSLTEFTTYKLDTLLAMPEKFSLEFDILTRADQADDLVSFSFGFARDNSVRSYNGNAITTTQIHYWNQEIVNSSKDTKVYNTQDFPLDGHANALMHVSIQVNGENMKVYLDKAKVLDTRMFDPGVKKYFYMSTSTELNNDARIAVSNFKLATFVP